jgi:hypothetical protein
VTATGGEPAGTSTTHASASTAVTTLVWEAPVIGAPSAEILRAQKRLREWAMHEQPEKFAAWAAPTQMLSEGRLPKDREKIATDLNRGHLEILMNLAVCGHWLDGEVGERCRTTALPFLKKWLSTFHPQGNPIDNAPTLKLLWSLDLLRPYLDNKAEARALVLLREYITKGDDFYARLPSQSKTHINNWRTWNLVFRVTASVLLQDSKEIQKSKELMAVHLTRNLVAPPGWKPDPECANNFGEKNYGGFDFRHRDALHYHLYNLEGLASLVILAPQMFSADGTSAILEAAQFIRPYFLGEKKRVDFICSTVEFDQVRGREGVPGFTGKRWDPKDARRTLRWMRFRFRDSLSWTDSIVDSNYSPWMKYVAARFGDQTAAKLAVKVPPAKSEHAKGKAAHF